MEHRVSYDQSSIVTEIGVTRRHERSLRRGSVRRTNIITDLPSRNVGILQSVDSISEGGHDGFEDIVKHLQQESDLHEDTPKSVKDRLEVLREMPQSLTLKRRVRDRLSKSAERKSYGLQPSCFARCGYYINYSFSNLAESIKNLKTRLEPWYYLLKTVEGHFGSGVATYFKFLRSLLLINTVVFAISLAFIVTPQVILSFRHDSPMVKPPPFRFGHLFTGEGYLAESALFYGYYSNGTLDITGGGYNMPNAYFFSSLLCYAIVFILLSISMAISYRKSFIKGFDESGNVFASKIFCGWDFGIATEDARELKARSIYTELKELLEEERVLNTHRNWFMRLYTFTMQLSLNLLLAGIVAVGAYFSWKFLRLNARDSSTETTMMVSLAFTIIVHVGPMIFSFILRYEEYESPRTATYVTLVRTFVLDAVVIVVAVAHRLGVAEDTKVCWETSLGQEVYRLVLLDALIGLVGTSLAEFIRYRLSLSLWKGIGKPEIDVARNTINLLYNQTLLYVGLYFSPLLSLVIVIKLLLTLYVKYWCAIGHCQPSSRMWRAAQTQTIFLTSAFIAFVGVLILYGYVLSSVRTSDCGPFRGQKLTYDAVVTALTETDKSSTVWAVLLYVRKPGVMAVLLVIMCLGAYYLRAVGRSRARVLRILRDVLQLHARDKEYLLKELSKFHLKHNDSRSGDWSVWSPQQRTVLLSQSERDLRPEFQPTMRIKSLSLYDLQAITAQFLDAERESSDSSLGFSRETKLRFNPVFTESPAPSSSTFVRQVRSTDDHDERIPSRISFATNSRKYD